MKTFAVIALLVGFTYGNPAKLDDVEARSDGYVITPPPEIPDLYKVPETPPPPPPDAYLPPDTTTTTTTTSTEPPTPPSGLYGPPETPPPPPPHSGPPDTPMMLMPYQFRYDVDDSDSGSHYEHSVVSDGENVKGEYSVMLPDGRRQVVKFTSNPETGYVADVSYA